MKEKEMELIGDWIHIVLSDLPNQKKKKEVLQSVHELCKKFPFYL
jgi:glycine/serine hydroxymethyltransferase